MNGEARRTRRDRAATSATSRPPSASDVPPDAISKPGPSRIGPLQLACTWSAHGRMAHLLAFPTRALVTLHGLVLAAHVECAAQDHRVVPVGAPHLPRLAQVHLQLAGPQPVGNGVSGVASAAVLARNCYQQFSQRNLFPHVSSRTLRPGQGPAGQHSPRRTAARSHSSSSQPSATAKTSVTTSSGGLAAGSPRRAKSWTRKHRAVSLVG